MKIKYSIGEISKLFDIPITTLRHYDNKGIFKAKYVDSESGYRYYTFEQFELLANIINLRYSKVSIDKIKEYTEKGDFISLKRVLLNQKMELRKKIEELERAENSLKERISHIEEVERINVFGKVLSIQRNKRRIISMKKEFETEEELELLIRKLGKQSKKNYTLPTGNIGLLMEKDSDFKKYFGIYIKNENESEEKIEQQQSGEYLVIYFKGKRKDKSKYYKILKEYIETNKIITDDIYYEMALIGTSSTTKEREYIRMIEIRKK